jgi:hypothetical protein
VDGLGELFEADGVGVDEPPVDPALVDDLAQQSVEQGQVGSGPDRQVQVGLLGDRRGAGVDHDQPGRVRSSPTVQQRLGQVVEVLGMDPSHRRTTGLAPDGRVMKVLSEHPAYL